MPKLGWLVADTEGATVACPAWIEGENVALFSRGYPAIVIMIPSEMTTVGFRGRGIAAARWCGGVEGKDRSCERNDSARRGPCARVRGCGEVARGNGGAAGRCRACGGGRPDKRHRRCRPSRTRPWTASPCAPPRLPMPPRRAPAMLRVIAEIGAGDVFEGTIGDGECVRIMTGACLPADADAVVKYEIVGVVEGDGKPGSVVSFCGPDEGGLQHPRRRRGGPCGGRGRGGGRCAHRRRRRLSGRLRRAGGARLPPTARGRHRHGQRARAAFRGARPRQDPQLQQLRHGRLRPRGRRRGP